MPNFWEDFPKEDKPGKWRTRVILVKAFFNDERKVHVYNSLHKAYVKVRWHAFWTDFWTSNQYFGVQWGIKRIDQQRDGE